MKRPLLKTKTAPSLSTLHVKSVQAMTGLLLHSTEFFQFTNYVLIPRKNKRGFSGSSCLNIRVSRKKTILFDWLNTA